MPDSLQKLLFSKANVRGQTLTLEDALENALIEQDLPEAARALAGEVCTAALLASASIQFDGTLLLQIAGDGPIKLIVAEVRPGYLFRVSVRLRDPAQPLPSTLTMKELINANGQGRCALILDPKNRARDVQPYQGIVALEGETFSEVIENYFEGSEQISTRVFLKSNGRQAGGMMLQKMPATGGEMPVDYDEKGWDNLNLFAQTVKDEELLTLSAEDLNRRLFWEMEPLVIEEGFPTFECTCSTERVEKMILSLGKDEALSLVANGESVKVKCDFCGKVHEVQAHRIHELLDVPEKEKVLH